MAIFGPLDVVREQTQGWAGFAVAMAYLDEVFRPGSEANRRLVTMAAGDNLRVDLADGVFALEQAYLSRDRHGLFESHQRYLDIQVVVTGEEFMEVADRSRLTVKEAYDQKRDLAFYHDYTVTSVLRIAAGEAAVFAPADAHMPGVRSGATPELVRKVVVKVPV